MPTTYYIAWWNVENLFDEENSPRRTDKLKRVLGNDINGWTPALRDQKLESRTPPHFFRPTGLHVLSGQRGFSRTAGGWLKIDSAPGEGTAVEFWIPESDVTPA